MARQQARVRPGALLRSQNAVTMKLCSFDARSKEQPRSTPLNGEVFRARHAKLNIPSAQ